MNVRDFLKTQRIILDGGMGTELQKRGLKPGELTETWNITHADEVIAVHKEYFDNGSNIVYTNTFGANLVKFSKEDLEVLIPAAIRNAKRARELSCARQEKFIALDIGPLGKLLKPYGDLEFEDAVNMFKYIVDVGKQEKPDLVVIETMSDSYETKAALLAVKENCDLPVIVTNSFGEDGKLLTGATVKEMVALTEGMGADAIGVNCGLGPRQLLSVVKEYIDYAKVPVVCKPNAGIPRFENGVTYFDVSPIQFANEMKDITSLGTTIVGGCCGTNPEYIKLLSDSSYEKIERKESEEKTFDKRPIIIGERVNPTGKKRLKQALIDNDITYILNEVKGQEELGCDWIDVNVGIPEIKEEEVLPNLIKEIQAITRLPLVIDTSNPVALEKSLRVYDGIAIINSVNGKKESMETIFPLAKKYGGYIIALTLDEDGIPESTSKRFEIAQNIVRVAKMYGISKDRLIFDPLAMTISTSSEAGEICLDTVTRISDELGCKTSLGVSNVSFGLPARNIINRTFLTLALDRGLCAAILNPYSSDMMETIYAYRAINGLDVGCSKYIEYAKNIEDSSKPQLIVKKENKQSEKSLTLTDAIYKGMKKATIDLTIEALKSNEPMTILNEMVIPPLNKVGKAFEEKKLFLPQLLMSADAAGAAFELIKKMSPGEKPKNIYGITIVLATVKGDVHDIGKNIVRMLLENYGFNVIDLGKDVSPEIVVESILENHAEICGLSALMTTTIPSMKETIDLIKEKARFCKVVVGGAVLTKEYATKMAADYYSETAMDTVEFAKQIASVNHQ